MWLVDTRHQESERAKNESGKSLGPFIVICISCGALCFPEKREANKADSVRGCHLQRESKYTSLPRAECLCLVSKSTRFFFLKTDIMIFLAAKTIYIDHNFNGEFIFFPGWLYRIYGGAMTSRRGSYCLRLEDKRQ